MSDTIAADDVYASDQATASELSNWSQRFDQLEHWLAKTSDYLNPILVKETRQALKSRQFGLTFVLLLVLCWVATIGGVAIVGPGIYYSAAGGMMLAAYFCILIFPLALVVPFSAYRSLTGEREENTYDLLRVSTLSPHQIIRGKLGSAMVQMGVYLSAVAPCVAFTYLLRGVDVVSIAVILLYATLASLGLSMIGLFAAALVQQKHGQVLLSVLFVSQLLASGWGGIILTVWYLNSGGSLIRDSEFWIVTGVLVSIYITTFVLIYLAAVALISYKSENRSTSLRWAMIAQQAVFVGWMTLPWITEQFEDGVLVAAFILATIYWYVMGTMLTTETAELSHRVRRDLPQSKLGRLLLGLLNPGPGTGYLFAIANLVSVMALVSIAMACIYLAQLPARGTINYLAISLVMIIYTSYVITYLGLGKLLVTALRRVAPVTGVAGFLIHVLLVLAGSGIPTAIQLSLRSWRNAGYTILQWSNPFWTADELLNGGPESGPEVQLQAMVMLAVAACVFILNIPSVARELMQQRVSLPSRIVQDEAELHPVQSKPQSPWEEDETTDASTDS